MNSTNEIAKALLEYHTANQYRREMLKLWFTGYETLYVPREYDDAVIALVGEKTETELHDAMMHRFLLIVSQWLAEQEVAA